MLDKFVAFLADYYIWFLVAAGVFLFALVGLIIGTKKNRKKEGGDMLAAEVKPVESFRNEATPEMVSAPVAESTPVVEPQATPMTEVTPAVESQPVSAPVAQSTPVVEQPVAPVVEPTMVMPTANSNPTVAPEEASMNRSSQPEPVININDSQNTSM